jgi:uncharacterized protein YbcC (UPF0753/DUF2309 family)
MSARLRLILKARKAFSEIDTVLSGSTQFLDEFKQLIHEKNLEASMKQGIPMEQGTRLPGIKDELIIKSSPIFIKENQSSVTTPDKADKRGL